MEELNRRIVDTFHAIMQTWSDTNIKEFAFAAPTDIYLYRRYLDPLIVAHWQENNHLSSYFEGIGYSNQEDILSLVCRFFHIWLRDVQHLNPVSTRSSEN